MTEMLDFDPSLVPNLPDSASTSSQARPPLEDPTVDLLLSNSAPPTPQPSPVMEAQPAAARDTVGLIGWIVATLLAFALLAGWAYAIKDAREARSLETTLRKEIWKLTEQLENEAAARRRAEASAEINAQVAAGILTGAELQPASPQESGLNPPEE